MHLIIVLPPYKERFSGALRSKLFSNCVPLPLTPSLHDLLTPRRYITVYSKDFWRKRTWPLSYVLTRHLLNTSRFKIHPRYSRCDHDSICRTLIAYWIVLTISLSQWWFEWFMRLWRIRRLHCLGIKLANRTKVLSGNLFRSRNFDMFVLRLKGTAYLLRSRFHPPGYPLFAALVLQHYQNMSDWPLALNS